MTKDAGRGLRLSAQISGVMSKKLTGRRCEGSVAQLDAVMPMLFNKPRDAGVSFARKDKIEGSDGDRAVDLPCLRTIGRAVADHTNGKLCEVRKIRSGRDNNTILHLCDDAKTRAER